MEKPPTVGGSLSYARVRPTNAVLTVADMTADSNDTRLDIE